MISSILRWLLLLLFLYVLAAGAAFVAQDFFLFPGRRTTNGQRVAGMANDYEQVQIEVGDIGMAYGVYRHFNDARGVALVLLDEDECAANALPILEGLAGIGMEAMCIDYPGYGGSLGKTNANNIRAVAHAAYLNLTGARDIDTRRIWIVGHGFGSGPACYVASHWPVAGLILLAPFTSFKDLVASRYPWLPARLLLRHEFDNVRELGSVRAPALLVWSQDDPLVPARLSERLAQLASCPVTRFVLSSGGHRAAGIEPDNPVMRAIDEFVRSR